MASKFSIKKVQYKGVTQYAIFENGKEWAASYPTKAAAETSVKRAKLIRKYGVGGYIKMLANKKKPTKKRAVKKRASKKVSKKSK